MARQIISLILISALLFVSTSVAETTCDSATPLDCTINIHINIAFSYNDSEISQNQIDSWVKEIEDTWNGVGGYQTYGDCGCQVKFQVNAIKITDPAQANCNPGPPGYHCIMITDYDKNQPKNEAGDETYRAYMYGVTQGGQSTNGWWSDSVSTPHPDSPTGENALDAAHEAGHMLGLDDDYDKGPPERYGKNIMGTTHGDDAKPTQEQIDAAVENVCTQPACPDECCCGNGIIEDDKGEDCDPFADPQGCESGEYCCKLCCGCHNQGCMPELGSYSTKEDCEEQCKDGDCYFNYDTGCWDCVERNVTITPSPADSVTPAPGGPADSVTPTGGTSISSILGVLGILLGVGILIGGFRTGAKSFMMGGIIIALLGLMIMIMQPLDLPPEPIEVSPPKPEGTAIGTISPMYAVQTWDPDPEPAEDPDEPILIDKFESVEDNIAWEDTGNGPVIPETDDNDSLEREGLCSDAGGCPVGFVCINLECVPDVGPDPCISNIQCKGDEICDEGECKSCDGNRIEGCPCSVYKWCKTGYECIEGICQIETDPVCGDGICEGSEDCEACGDCECDNDEVCDPDNSEADKSGCVDEEDLEPYCGDGMCDPASGETCECEDCEGACPIGLYCNPDAPDADPLGCSSSPPGGSVCGDGFCEETEHCNTCPVDCMDSCLAQGKCCHPDFGCVSDCGPVDV